MSIIALFIIWGSMWGGEVLVGRGQNRVSFPLKLELQAGMSCLMWVLGTMFKFSAEEANSLNY